MNLALELFEFGRRDIANNALGGILVIGVIVLLIFVVKALRKGDKE
jgi:hypothetical protein